MSVSGTHARTAGSAGITQMSAAIPAFALQASQDFTVNWSYLNQESLNHQQISS
jgi:hypothetical protein